MNRNNWYRIYPFLICLTMLFALTIGKVNASKAQKSEVDFDAIDVYVTEQMNKLGIPGIALGIVQDGQIVHLQGFGVADSSERAITPQTPFYISSLTKSFTALAVMQLVEAEKINLDAPVQTYLPWFELADKQASAKITVRNLLNQTSGISTEDGNRFWISRQDLEEHVRELNKVQLTQPVGSIWQYSNLNYSISGLIVEKVSGQSYSDYVNNNIFKPLDMRHSYTSHASALADGLAAGHHYMFGQAFEREYAFPLAGIPGGGIIASVEDMTHYIISQLGEGRFGDTSILSAQGIAELHAPAISTGGDEQYAMGWNVATLDGIHLVLHTGDIGNFHSVLVLMPDLGSGFILLANASGFEQLGQVDGIAGGVFNLLNGNPPAPVSVPVKVRFIYWAVLLTPLLMLFGIAYSWRRWLKKGIGHILLMVLLYSGLATLWLVVVPNLTESSLPIICVVDPELAYAVIASAVLGIGWSIIFTAMSLKMLKSQ